MLSNYPRNANQNNNAVPSHTCQNGQHQQINKRQVWERLRRKRNPRALLVGMRTGADTVENSMEFPQKTENGTPISPSNPTSRNISQKTRNTNWKGYMYRMFIAAQSTIARIWKQPRCPSADDWIQKLWYIYTMEYYAAIKKEGILIVCSNLDGSGEHYAE